MSVLERSDARRVADAVAQRYSDCVQVEAVALGDSLATGLAELGSDIDLYVYLNAELPLSVRATIAEEHTSYAEVDNRFWEFGDEWIDANAGTHVDVTFRSPGWIESDLERVLDRCEASVGYSTCIWHNVMSSIALFDRSGWFTWLKQGVDRPYPDALRCAIVAKNQWHTKPVERLGVPAIMMTDGPHLLRKVEGDDMQPSNMKSVPATCFPSGVGLAAGWDRDLLIKVGRALAEEAQTHDVGIALGPAVNIKRSPLCGRNFEYLSEDPYLTGWRCLRCWRFLRMN